MAVSEETKGPDLLLQEALCNPVARAELEAQLYIEERGLNSSTFSPPIPARTLAWFQRAGLNSVEARDKLLASRAHFHAACKRANVVFEKARYRIGGIGRLDSMAVLGAQKAYGRTLTPGTYSDAAGRVKCDELQQTESGYQPLVEEWRLHVEEASMVLRATFGHQS